MNSVRLAFLVLALALASFAHGAVKSVVLVHGAFADGSGWKAVADILQHDGYTLYRCAGGLQCLDRARGPLTSASEEA